MIEVERKLYIQPLKLMFLSKAMLKALCYFDEKMSPRDKDCNSGSGSNGDLHFSEV